MNVGVLETKLKSEIITLYKTRFKNNIDLREKLFNTIISSAEPNQFIINDLCIRGILIDHVQNISELDNCLINTEEILQKREMWIFYQFIKDSMYNVLTSGVGYGYGVTTLISDKSRVVKGGSWNDRAYWLSPGTRRFLEEDLSTNTIGFRCAMTHYGSPETTSKSSKTGQFFPPRRNKR